MTTALSVGPSTTILYGPWTVKDLIIMNYFYIPFSCTDYCLLILMPIQNCGICCSSSLRLYLNSNCDLFNPAQQKHSMLSEQAVNKGV